MKAQRQKRLDDAVKARTKAEAATKKAAGPKAHIRRSTRHQDQGDVAQTEASDEKSKKPTAKKLPTRGRPTKGSASQNQSGISRYFTRKDEQEKDEGPSVEEALAEAADDYEANPEALGAQDLIATEQPALITGGTMRQYQLEGLEWLKLLYMNGLCGILADEMGLGKTIQSISLLAFLKEQEVAGPYLIVAPLSTIDNWMNEFKRWTPSINAIQYYGSKDARAEIRNKKMKLGNQKDSEFPIVVTSYEIAMRDRKFLAAYDWRYIIVDEGHRLKNMNCRLIRELMLYESEHRLLITGTPLQNNIAELWSLLHFLLPTIFDDLNGFEKWFEKYSDPVNDPSSEKSQKHRQKLVSMMHAILKPFLLRRLKTDVETSLPPKREYVLYAPLTKEQKELYSQILDGNSRSYLEGKAFERLEAIKSRSASLKRKSAGSGASTPAKSLKTSRASTPASGPSRSACVRSGRKGRKGRKSYKEDSDDEFDAKLQRFEKGEQTKEDMEGQDYNQPLSSDEENELSRAATFKLARKEISGKKLQNPVMQARLVCNSPHNFYWPWQHQDDDETKDGPGVDESIVSASGKLLLLDQLLPRLFDNDHKVLIFSQFKVTLDIIEAYVSELRGWNVCRIDGSIPQSERAEQIKSFNEDKSMKLFLLSTRAGGQGINLAAADTVILFDSDWNPQQDLQAMDRAHRIGQTRPVVVYRLATKGTVEEALLAKAEGNRRLEKMVIQKGKFKSLIDGEDSGGVPAKLGEDDELRAFMFGRGAAGVGEFDGQAAVLSEADLDTITDRSEAAYQRAESGADAGKDGVFAVTQTNRVKEEGGITTE